MCVCVGGERNSGGWGGMAADGQGAPGHQAALASRARAGSRAMGSAALAFSPSTHHADFGLLQGTEGLLGVGLGPGAWGPLATASGSLPAQQAVKQFCKFKL